MLRKTVKSYKKPDVRENKDFYKTQRLPIQNNLDPEAQKINIDLRKDGASSSKLMVSKNNENYNQSEVDSFSNLRQMRLPPV